MNEENINVQEEAVEQKPDENTKRTPAKTIVEFVSVIATSIVAIMVIFTFAFRIVGVSGPSMMNTLQDGDRLIISNLFYPMFLLLSSLLFIFVIPERKKKS